MTAYYFGCWHGAGHYAWIPGMHALPPGRKYWYPDTPWVAWIDGTLTPGKRDYRGKLPYEEMDSKHQSEAALHHKDGWTALAIHDFTEDSRPNSNSVFFFDEILDAGAACAKAAVTFPQVWGRIEKAKAVMVVEEHN